MSILKVSDAAVAATLLDTINGSQKIRTLRFPLVQLRRTPRGGMDASQYKDFVLVLLFIKYISDKYAGQP
jgi:hypothetical protein